MATGHTSILQFAFCNLTFTLSLRHYGFNIITDSILPVRPSARKEKNRSFLHDVHIPRIWILFSARPLCISSSLFALTRSRLHRPFPRGDDTSFHKEKL